MPFTQMRYHLVWATKNREPLISLEMEDLLRATLFHKATKCNGQIEVIGNVEDHIHLILAIPPSWAVSDFVRELKASSSYAIRNHFPIGTYFSWQEGYGGFTLNALDYKDAVRYVVNQKAHHAQNKVWRAFERMEDSD